VADQANGMVLVFYGYYEGIRQPKSAQEGGTMKRWVLCLAVLLLIPMLLPQSVHAALINFDDVASDTAINNQYSALGVTFSKISPTFVTGGDVLATTPGGSFFPALSSPNIVSLVSGVGFDVEDGYIRADFSTPQSLVSISSELIWAPEGFGTTGTAFLQAFDSSNNQIAIATSTTGFAWNTLTVSGANISKVYFSVDYGQASIRYNTYGFFDNFQFGEDGNGTSVPEPGTMLLLGSGLLGLVGYGRMRQNK
jgi:hypothetical protein